ncbi:MAG: hypothetical protein IPJ58_02465 [Ardenticatenia bacterium]|nr:hypothetical protein [Ardenticatenia bacterium]
MIVLAAAMLTARPRAAAAHDRHLRRRAAGRRRRVMAAGWRTATFAVSLAAFAAVAAYQLWGLLRALSRDR